MSEKQLWSWASPVLAVLLCLSISVGYWRPILIWDDPEIFTHLSQTGWRQLWFEPVTGGRLGDGYYRPLSMSLLKWCDGPYWAHVCSAICHLLSAVALAVLLPKRAVFSVLIFMVHPLSSEILGWASALPDALALSLGLWSAVAIKRNHWGWGFVLVLLGGLSKETAWVPPLAVLLSTPDRSKMAKGWLSWGVALGLVIGMRTWSGVTGGWAILTKLAALPKALSWALSLLIWPWPLSIVRDLNHVPWPPLILGSILLCLMVLALCRSANRTGALMILLSIGLALPTTVDGGLLGERYCYMATAGLAILVGSQTGELSPRIRFGVSVMIAGFALGSVFTHHQRSPDWISDAELFGAAAVAYPESTFAHHFVGMVALREGQFDAAAAAFKAALKSKHAHASDRRLYLMSLVEGGQFTEAIDFAEAGQQSQLDAEYIAYWAKAHLGLGQRKPAIQLLQILCQENTGCDGPDWIQTLYVTAVKE